MDIKFFGNLEELKSTLARLEPVGAWLTVNNNQYQFRHQEGGVLNWYPSTGSITFQGKPTSRELLESLVLEIMIPPPAVTVSEVAIPSNDPSQVRDPAPAGNTSEAVTPSVSQEERDAEPISMSNIHTVTSSQSSKETETECEIRNYSDSEVVIGLVGAVGTEMAEVSRLLNERLRIAGYSVHEIRVSNQVIPKIVAIDTSDVDEATRITRLMDAGTEARRQSNDSGILATGVAAEIASFRNPAGSKLSRQAFIVNSLKHPEEVSRLRQTYPQGFYLIGVHPDENIRSSFLRNKGIKDTDINRLVERDKDEHLRFGQRLNDTFHMSDFFVHLDNDRLKLQNSLHRILDLLFGNPYITPTFDEFAMFLAFTSSLRSADLSRQVGAVVAKRDEILATGANDCPKYGGGLYWPEWNVESHSIEDKDDGRDYKRGQDSNKIEQQKIIENILQNAKAAGIDTEKLTDALEKSRIQDLTEYGRVVHAEMEALLSCARNNISTRGSQLFCTTFPCHNCAKHIIAAGIDRVIFIEPYQKSKAVEFHTDSISVGFGQSGSTVHFEPFVGVGPRRFFDLFSVRLGAGYGLKRKDEDGLVIPWILGPEAKLRIQMLPGSYLELESEAKQRFEKLKLK